MPRAYSSASSTPAPLRFRGTPASLAAVLPSPIETESDMTVSMKVGSRKGPPLEALVQTDFDPRILRLNLPEQVPPGVYKAMLLVDGAERAVQIEVDPAPQLHVVPEQLRIDAHPGDLVGADLTILNQGNVPAELRSLQAIGIFMNGGIERALRRAYVHTLEKGERRVDVIADSLAEAHGGLLKMKIEQGSGVLAAGEVRELHVVLHVPTHIERGAQYGGNWELPGLVYPISIQVPNGEVPKDEEPKPPKDEEPEPPKARKRKS